MVIDIRDLSNREKLMILNGGFQALNEEIPESWLEDPNTCPCVIEGSCEGIKDSDYIGRCVGGDFGYQSCDIYKACVKGVEPSYIKPESQALEETVVMHGDKIVSKKSNRMS